MTDIVIQGIYGRMGRALIEKIAARQDCRVVAGVDREAGKVGDIPVYAGFEGLPKVDAIIDFSSPAGAVAAVQYGAVHGVPCVICSTGLSAEDETVLEDASAKTPIFRSANMSLGVNVLIELARQATRVLSGEFDIEIVEKHHHNKLDAPSGTALMIADAINAEAGNSYEYVYDRSQVRQKRGAKELGISSVRGGGIVGEHDVLFCGPEEVLTLSHSAGSRGVFADGAVQAALYVAGRVLKSRCLFRRTSNCTQATIRGAGRILAHIHFTGKVAMLDCCTASAAACRTYNTAKILRSLAVGRQFSCCIAVDDLCITRQLTSNSAAMTGRQRQFTRIYAIANLAVTICKANNTTCIQAARVPREQQITCIPTVINHRIACLATQSYHTVHKIFVIGKRHICRAVKNCAAASKTGNRTVIRILPLGINVDRSLHSQAGNLSIFNIAKKTAENRCPIHIRKIQVAYGVAIAVEFAAEAVLYFTVRIHR